MGIENLIIFLLIGAVAGWLAGRLMKGRGFGIIGSIIHATIGAVILLFVIGLIKKI